MIQRRKDTKIIRETLSDATKVIMTAVKREAHPKYKPSTTKKTKPVASFE
ncbi:MAG: hypothetical protein LBL13_13535 [Bacteroidales bacterium]|jgi:hypothetical protein|nr:hypothetical protein [Bacteroidales bacterium]